MNNFSYFTDTKIEYELAMKRLSILEERKMEIWQRYFGVKSPRWDKIGAQGSRDDSDKMVRYLEEINRSTGKSLSLEQEIAKIRNEADRLEKVLKEMTKRLRKTDTIEGKMYYLIVVERQSVSKAIKHLSETEFMSEKNLWKTYYPKIKEDVRKLRKKD